MDMFDFEELIAEMLNISNEQREDDSVLEQTFYENFDMDMEQGFEFARKLLEHTPQVTAGLSGTKYHAFVSKKSPVMLMKIEAAKAA
ncbi:MAG: hypothetical protein P1U32_09570 [Legionellaceae bacterium]|nr:hypothetical protein [Legionellaceae bacterium]